ncbi:hypothetical protein FGO68_gene9953 [Halteria grandinella]|uniref:Uncharacterized protein n=1 Tax=Halteria grandinella TaxID=5974 RepID=A0A8J8NWD7_HALGN|nr:hypothetical protein FGO68_gene9953 [Halteria grandinella]
MEDLSIHPHQLLMLSKARSENGLILGQHRQTPSDEEQWDEEDERPIMKRLRLSISTFNARQARLTEYYQGGKQLQGVRDVEMRKTSKEGQGSFMIL